MVKFFGCRLAVVLMVMLIATIGADRASAQSNIGVASGAKNQVEGVVEGKTQTIAIGNNVFASELVRTGVDSMAQLLFLDQTSLSVAPQSQVTLDRFVYDPARGAGAVALRATVGAFRFVTGTQNANSYRIETPVATISVRGTILDLLVWPDRTIVILQEGQATVTAVRTQASYALTTPGTAFVIQADGRVEGPITWDSTIIHIKGSVPFPLFGNTLWPSQHDIQTFDDRKTLNDILNADRSSNGFSRGGCPPGAVPITFNGITTCSP